MTVRVKSPAHPRKWKARRAKASAKVPKVDKVQYLTSSKLALRHAALKSNASRKPSRSFKPTNQALGKEIPSPAFPPQMTSDRFIHSRSS